MRTVGLPESPKACRLDSTFPTLTDPWRDLQPRSDDSSMSTAIPSVPSISATQFPGTRAEAFLAQSLQCPCHFSAWFTSFVKVVARPRSKQTSWNQLLATQPCDKDQDLAEEMNGCCHQAKTLSNPGQTSSSITRRC